MSTARTTAALAVAALLSRSSLAATHAPARTSGAAPVAARTAGASTSGDCTLILGALDFGRYDFRSDRPSDFATTLVYRCAGRAPTIAIQGDRGAAGSGRSMTRGATRISYDLYLDAARTRVWGDGTGGTAVHVGQAGSEQHVTIYGRIPAHQSAPAGAYLDAVVIALRF